MAQPASLCDQPLPFGRIGPNAITRMAEALISLEGRSAANHIFRSAGLERYIDELPNTMVSETDVSALMKAVAHRLELPRAKTTGWIAGQRTAEYLLAHRIPAPVQILLKVLPPILASRVLLKAIGRHSWTFAGTGCFTYEAGHPVRVSISNCPLCRCITAHEPFCMFYAATFEWLFQRLVHPSSKVVETHCEAKGDHACTFEIRWHKVSRNPALPVCLTASGSKNNTIPVLRS